MLRPISTFLHGRNAFYVSLLLLRLARRLREDVKVGERAAVDEGHVARVRRALVGSALPARGRWPPLLRLARVPGAVGGGREGDRAVEAVLLPGAADELAAVG